MKKVRIDISHFRFILLNLKIFGEIVTTCLLCIFILFCLVTGQHQMLTIGQILYRLFDDHLMFFDRLMFFEDSTFLFVRYFLSKTKINYTI